MFVATSIFGKDHYWQIHGVYIYVLFVLSFNPLGLSFSLVDHSINMHNAMWLVMISSQYYPGTF